jgi:hypothetical protein
MRAGINELSEIFVGEDKADEFALWAFGKDYLDLITLEDFAEEWNKRHVELFKIDKSLPVIYDMIKMTDLWRQIIENKKYID